MTEPNVLVTPSIRIALLYSFDKIFFLSVIEIIKSVTACRCTQRKLHFYVKYTGKQ